MDARGLPASGREAAARTAAVAGERTVSAYDNVKLYSEYTMKTGNLICLLLSLAIVGHVVYALLSESEPSRLVSQGKSYTVKELNNEGYNPPLKTEVEVLCKVDHSTLVRGPKGYQFLVPEGGLERLWEALLDREHRCLRMQNRCMGLRHGGTVVRPE